MLKSLSHVDEIIESHKKNGITMQKNQDTVIKKKEENINNKKIINPKFIFEKKPKNYKNTNSSSFRSPNLNNELPTIKEIGY